MWSQRQHGTADYIIERPLVRPRAAARQAENGRSQQAAAARQAENGRSQHSIEQPLVRPSKSGRSQQRTAAHSRQQPLARPRAAVPAWTSRSSGRERPFAAENSRSPGRERHFTTENGRSQQRTAARQAENGRSQQRTIRFPPTSFIFIRTKTLNSKWTCDLVRLKLYQYTIPVLPMRSITSYIFLFINIICHYRCFLVFVG